MLATERVAIAGERRLRAAEMAGVDKIPVRVVTVDERTAHICSLTGNLPREDLLLFEEAPGKDNPVDDPDGDRGERVSEVLQNFGMSLAPFVDNRLSMPGFPADLLQALERGEISLNMARVIALLPDVDERVKLLQRVRQEGLSIRQARALAQPRKADPLNVLPPRLCTITPAPAEEIR